MARFYLTTAIDYANGDPHIGHAYEKIGADVIARYRRLAGDDVHFLIGMDEHGQKVAQAAADRGIGPQEFVDQISELFRSMWSRLGISNDQFIRTTEPAHKAGARALIKRIHASSPDDFYERRMRAGTASAVSSSSAKTRSPTASACSTRPATCSGPRSATGSSGSRTTASS
jgi:methionyl-tRNA synthetase